MRYLKWLGIGLSLICIYFLGSALAEHWSNFRWTTSIRSALPGIFYAALLYLASYPAAILAWQIILKSFDSEPRFIDLASVHLMSQIGKYLPGNVAHHVGRVVLGNSIGIAPSVGMKSLALDIIVLLFAALLCSLPALSFLMLLISDRGVSAGTYWIAAGITAVVLIGIVFVFLKFPSRLGGTMEMLRSIGRPSNVPRLSAALIMYCLCFILGAAALNRLCEAFSLETVSFSLTTLGIYAAAWTAGFLVPGAPAGLGVRDAGLLLGLSQVWPGETALAGVAALRLITTVSDGVVFLFGYAISRRFRAENSTKHEK